jgi:hypothetical protein
MHVAFLGRKNMGVVDRIEPKSVAVKGVASNPD